MSAAVLNLREVREERRTADQAAALRRYWELVAEGTAAMLAAAELSERHGLLALIDGGK